MPIEVELKARLADPDTTIELLRCKVAGESSVYRDTYYDWPDNRLELAGRQELRLRVIESAAGTKCLWTFKGAMLDDASTPEFETTVADGGAAHSILMGLGLEPVITYTKQCENFRWTHDSYPVLATVVRVPEIGGAFLEVETVVADGVDTAPAQRAIEAVLADLHLGGPDLEPTYYVDMVRAARHSAA